ncbi:MAG: sporulation membrane protein YtaF [Bacillota bacterium]
MEIISLIIFVLAISLDGLAVGITYGLREIKLPLTSLLIIGLTSALSVLASMLFGDLLTAFLSFKLAELLGGGMLIIVGLSVLYQALKQIIVEESLEGSEILITNSSLSYQLLDLEIESLGIVIKILKEPVRADFDYSGVISQQEALFLGFALAVDAFGAGIGAAMTGFAPLITALLAGVVIFGCLSVGLSLGSKFNLERFDYRITLLPGLLLIILGVIKLL